MIDLKLIREHPDLVKRAARDKNMTCDVDQILAVDARRRTLETEFGELRHKQNQTGERIAKAPKEEKAALAAEMGTLKARLKEIDDEKAALEAQLQQLMLLVPQIPAYDEGVPVGASAAQNVPVRTVGTPKRKEEFGFAFRDHVELGAAHNLFDVDRGVKIAGSRNYLLTGAGAMLHEAVLRLAWDVMLRAEYPRNDAEAAGGAGILPASISSEVASAAQPMEGSTDPSAPSSLRRSVASSLSGAQRPSLRFIPLTVPVLVTERLMYGTGFFPLHRDEVYLCERDEQALVGTAEVPVTGFHMDEILDEAELPKLYFARSTCFRREAGAAGRDTRGLYRIHFFDKLEQVVICKADAAESRRWHEAIIANAETVLQALELPYRVIEVCTGDMGQGKVRMYDIETWMPSRDAYSETHSASRFHDFQARRLNIRYRDTAGKVHVCHTLNNTVIASPRILIPLIETYQQPDGSIRIPAALRGYMGGIERVTP